MTLTELPAHALSRAIHAREVSCREVMQATSPASTRSIRATTRSSACATATRCCARPTRATRELARGDQPRLAARHAAGDQGHGADRRLRTTLGSPLLRDFVPDRRRPDGRSA